MNSNRLILWNPGDPEFPRDAWYVWDSVYWSCVPTMDDYDKFLRALLVSPDLEKVQGNLASIALRHGLADDETGKLAALHSVLLAVQELRERRSAIFDRHQACVASGDARGQEKALEEQARLEPYGFEHWRALAAHVEKSRSAAAALECLDHAEPHHRNNHDFWMERLRLVCACGTRQEALAEGRRFRERFGDFAELMIQADEDFLLAWRSDPDALEWRREDMEDAARGDSGGDPIDAFKDGRDKGFW